MLTNDVVSFEQPGPGEHCYENLTTTIAIMVNILNLPSVPKRHYTLTLRTALDCKALK